MDDPISFFAGAWEFDRQVEDRITGQDGEAHGMAVFERLGDGLVWVETGELMFGGQAFEASRRMSITPEHGRWLVRFEDGRPFHSLDLSQGRDRAEHLCVADMYTGDLWVETEGPEKRFFTSWRVEGPAKDQLIETAYKVM